MPLPFASVYSFTLVLVYMIISTIGKFSMYYVTCYLSHTLHFFQLSEDCSYCKLIPCRWTPYGTTKCIICKQQMHQDGKYCHTCAYSKGDISCSDVLLLLLYCIMKVHNSILTCFVFAGVCAMCGKQVLDTKFYKQSNV